MERWVRLLRKLGWKYRLGKVSYWDGQLIGITPEGEEIPICVEGVINGAAYIITAKELVASEEQLEELKVVQRINEAQPGDFFWEKPHKIKIKRSGRRYKIEVVLLS